MISSGVAPAVLALFIVAPFHSVFAVLRIRKAAFSDTSSALRGFHASLHTRRKAFYLPKNYTESLAKHRDGLHNQVFNTSTEVKASVDLGKSRREEWISEQLALQKLIDGRLKKIEDCTHLERYIREAYVKVCNETKEKNELAAAKDPPGDFLPLPDECKEYHDIDEFCYQPQVPIDLSHGLFGNELMELARMHEDLEVALAVWIQRSHNEGIQLLDEVRRYYQQQIKLSDQEDVQKAKAYALKAVDLQKAEVEKLIKAREEAFLEDKKFFGDVAKRAQNNAKSLCGGATASCSETKLRIALEAEEDTIQTSNWALYRHDTEQGDKAENIPWSIAACQEFLAYLPNQIADIKSDEWPHDNSWFDGPKLPNLKRLSNPGWAWDERRAHELAVMDGLETILETGERYFDHQFANLLLHMGTRKAQITQLRIQPALREAGLLSPDDPDMSEIELIQKEIALLIKVAAAERKYHWEEQSRIWSLKPFVDAATRDMDRPDDMYKWCQITSTRWYKCRASSRQLLDYLQDTTSFLKIAVKPLLDMRNEIAYKYDPLYNHKEWVSNLVEEMNQRQEVLYDMWQELGMAEAIAEGDSNTERMEKMKTQMNAKLFKAQQSMEPLFSSAAQRSRQFQIKTAQRILELMDEKEAIIESLFYSGNTDAAVKNREAFQRMTTPDIWGLLNTSGQSGGGPWILSASGTPIENSDSRGVDRFLKVPGTEPPDARIVEKPSAMKVSVSEFKQGGLQRVLKMLHQNVIQVVQQ